MVRFLRSIEMIRSANMEEEEKRAQVLFKGYVKEEEEEEEDI